MVLSINERYVAYLDILGFEALVESEEPYSQIRKIVSALEERINYDGVRHPHLKYLFISDTIIILAEPGRSPLLLWKISQVQNSILKIGFATRGAITFGEIFEHSAGSARNIFGKPFVKAYRMETQQAFYPRVIIQPEITQLIESEYASKTTNRRRYDDLVTVGPDGAEYVRQFGRDVLNFQNSRTARKALANAKMFATKIENGFAEANAPGKLKWAWLKSEFERELGSLM